MLALKGYMHGKEKEQRRPTEDKVNEKEGHEVNMMIQEAPKLQMTKQP